MFSMSALPIEQLMQLGVLQGTSGLTHSMPVLSLGWPELEKVLPDRGLPRGVVEIASRAMRGGGTTIALRAIAAVHEADVRAWCAWIVPARAPSLYAPAVAQAGADLERLIVVRPEPAAIARTAVKVGASGAFDLVVIDAHGGLDGRLASGKTKGRVDGSVVVRKLALSAEEKGTTFVVLTDAYAARPVPWPVALRLEVERRQESLSIRITKDRRGRASAQHVVRLAS
jgi:recombination protein RecA